MRKNLGVYFFVLTTFICNNLFGQEKKMVAVMEPICRDSSVTMFYKNVVRGAVESVIAQSEQYEAYDRVAFDQICMEQEFQHSGVVNDSQIKLLGELAGVDYILVSELSAYDGYLSAIIKILNIESGRYDKAKDVLVDMNDVKGIRSKCKEITTLVCVGKATGELKLENGLYVGDYQYNKPHGKGKMIYNSSNSDGFKSYDGEWENGKMHGYGVLVWKNGAKYEGHFYKNMWKGEGKYYWPNGDITVGNWQSYNIQGSGTFYYADGRKFKGNFDNGVKQGKGTFYWPNGDIFEGEWSRGFIYGFGILYHNDGSREEGFWEYDKPNGFFTIYKTDGYKEQGNYVKGEKDGEWLRISPKGGKQKAIFSNGQIIKDWHFVLF